MKFNNQLEPGAVYFAEAVVLFESESHLKKKKRQVKPKVFNQPSAQISAKK